MKYMKPELHSFGYDVKHGNDCKTGSAADDGDTDNCTTGGGANGGCYCGSSPGKVACETGHAAKGTICNNGNGAKYHHHSD